MTMRVGRRENGAFRLLSGCVDPQGLQDCKEAMPGLDLCIRPSIPTIILILLRLTYLPDLFSKPKRSDKPIAAMTYLSPSYTTWYRKFVSDIRPECLTPGSTMEITPQVGSNLGGVRLQCLKHKLLRRLAPSVDRFPSWRYIANHEPRGGLFSVQSPNQPQM